jgi:hypothetical protein
VRISTAIRLVLGFLLIVSSTAQLAWAEVPLKQVAKGSTQTSVNCPKCPACEDCQSVTRSPFETYALALMAAQKAVRIKAISQLVKLKDSKVVGLLSHALQHDNELAVRIAAAQALSQLTNTAVEAALSQSLVLESDVGLRIAAAQGLGRQGTPTAFKTLYANQGSTKSEYGREIRHIMKMNYGESYAEALRIEPSMDRSGRWLLVTPMAMHGGLFMTMLADVAGGEPGELSFLGGATVGGVTPFLLSLKYEMSKASARWLSSTTTYGLLMGVSAAVIYDPDNSTPLPGAVMIGQALGLSVGLATLKTHPYSHGDILFMDSAGVIGGLFALGSGMYFNEPSPRTANILLQSGAAVGLVTAGILTRDMNLTSGDSATITVSTGVGVFTGLMGAELVLGDSGDSDDGRYRAASALVGLAAGFTTGSVLSQYIDGEVNHGLAASVALGWGASLGAGIGMAIPDDYHPRLVAGLSLAGGLSSLYVATQSKVDGFQMGDGAMMGLGMAFGLWNGSALGDYFFEESDRKTGLKLVGFGGGALTGALLGKYYDPTVAEVTMATSIGAWGGWLSYWVHYIANRTESTHPSNEAPDWEMPDADAHAAVTVVGADVGLALGSALLSPLMGVRAEDLVWVNVGGLLGMGLGTSLAAGFSDNIAEGNVIGTSLGLLTGAVMVATIDRLPNPAPGFFSKENSSMKRGRTQWTPTLAIEPLPDGQMRILLKVFGTN